MSHPLHRRHRRHPVTTWYHKPSLVNAAKEFIRMGSKVSLNLTRFTFTPSKSLLEHSSASFLIRANLTREKNSQDGFESRPCRLSTAEFVKTRYSRNRLVLMQRDLTCAASSVGLSKVVGTKRTLSCQKLNGIILCSRCRS